MDGDEIYSFAYDRQAVARVFQQVDTAQVLLGLLAGIPPEPAWTGLAVWEGPSPLDPDTTVCVGLGGPGAAAVQERLVTAFERLGVPVLGLWEGGPGVTRPLARAEDARWVTG